MSNHETIQSEPCEKCGARFELWYCKDTGPVAFSFPKHCGPESECFKRLMPRPDLWTEIWDQERDIRRQYNAGMKDGIIAHRNAHGYCIVDEVLKPKSEDPNYLKGFRAGWNKEEGELWG